MSSETNNAPVATNTPGFRFLSLPLELRQMILLHCFELSTPFDSNRWIDWLLHWTFFHIQTADIISVHPQLFGDMNLIYRTWHAELQQAWEENLKPFAELRKVLAHVWVVSEELVTAEEEEDDEETVAKLSEKLKKEEDKFSQEFVKIAGEFHDFWERAESTMCPGEAERVAAAKAARATGPTSQQRGYSVKLREELDTKFVELRKAFDHLSEKVKEWTGPLEEEEEEEQG